ncbi:MAG: two-component regulator propeller domain-containing protein [Phycisphaerales bacterium JB037]
MRFGKVRERAAWCAAAFGRVWANSSAHASAWLALLMCAQAIAQSPALHEHDYRIRTWEAEDGLPESSATAMVQTEEGYLWFGTFNGLVRFNGVQFRVFDAENSEGLPGSGVVNLCVLGDGRLLVSTTRGTAIGDHRGWRTVTSADGWRGDFVRSFAQRPDGKTLVTTFDGHILEWNGEFFTELPRPTGGAASSIAAVDADGTWWVARPGFVGWWDGTRWHTVLERVPEVVCAAARDGAVWVVTATQILKFRGSERIQARDLPERPGGLWSVTEDSAGNLWIATFDRGVLLVAPDGTAHRWNSATGLASDSIRFVFEDAERNIWIGTNGGGLSRFTQPRVRAFGTESGIKERIIKSVAPSADGSVLAATYGGGLYRIADGQPHRIDGGLRPDILQSVLEDRTGRVWVGTYGDGLFLLGDERATRISPAVTGGPNVIALFEDSVGRIWAAGGQGVGVLEQGNWKRLGEPEGLPTGVVFAFAEDRAGAIWISNGSGVYQRHGERFEEVLDPDGKPLENALSLLCDSKGAMWVGLARSGLVRYRDGEISRVGERVGLPDAAVTGIIEDGLGFTWLASDRGIIRVASEDLVAAADGRLERIRSQLLGRSDGMPSVQCTGARQPAIGRDTGGRLWFATIRGVVRVDPATFRTNEHPPVSRIESVSFDASGGGASDEPVQRQVRLGDALTEELKLPPGSRRIEIHYAGLSFVDSEGVRFEVMLEGLDIGWHEVGGARSVTYQQLPPGRYTFRVRAANSDGLWGVAPATLQLTVLPFFWQTAWFRAGSGLTLIAAGAGGAWWAAHRRTRQRRRENERFRLAMEASPTAMLILDRDHRITMANSQAEREFGLSRAELRGRPFDEFMPNARRPSVFDATDQPIEPRPGEPEFSGRHADGKRFPAEVSFSTIDTAEGPSVLVSIDNISNRVRMELEMAQQRAELAHLARVTMLGELSGSLAHELNQPLAAILSNAQAAQRLMARDEVDITEVREILADIVDQDKRAGEVIHGLRALLRNEQTPHALLDLGEVVQDVLRLTRSDLINRDVEASTELQPGVPPVLGDRVQLQQVLLNLVMNACDAMQSSASKHRHLTVRLQADDRVARVFVIDSGPGISSDIADKMFEPFTTTKADGMGLGLAVCRTIIAAHHGAIGAAPDAGGGAAVFFELPLHRRSDHVN